LEKKKVFLKKNFSECLLVVHIPLMVAVIPLVVVVIAAELAEQKLHCIFARIWVCIL
jgi:hypothetical protein